MFGYTFDQVSTILTSSTSGVTNNIAQLIPGGYWLIGVLAALAVLSLLVFGVRHFVKRGTGTLKGVLKTGRRGRRGRRR